MVSCPTVFGGNNVEGSDTYNSLILTPRSLTKRFRSYRHRLVRICHEATQKQRKLDKQIRKANILGHPKCIQYRCASTHIQGRPRTIIRIEHLYEPSSGWLDRQHPRHYLRLQNIYIIVVVITMFGRGDWNISCKKGKVWKKTLADNVNDTWHDTVVTITCRNVRSDEFRRKVGRNIVLCPISSISLPLLVQTVDTYPPSTIWHCQISVALDIFSC